MLKTLRHNGVPFQDFGLGLDHPPSQFRNWQQDYPRKQLFATEGLFFNQLLVKEVPPSFTMVREPTAHVISQFFHCQIQRRPNSEQMPETLLEWLMEWKTLVSSLEQQQDPFHSHAVLNPVQDPYRRWRDGKFSCYVPLNFQSWVTGVGSSSANSPSKTIKQQLEARFQAIGILSRFETSSCVFLTVALDHVPAVCDCTRGQQKQARRELPTYAHGVVQHGTTYNLTLQERRLIHELTAVDQHLYEQAVALFHKKVETLEHKHGVTLCGQY